MLRQLFICSFFFLPLCILAQSGESYSIYLVGDAGEDTVPGKALLMLQEELLKNSNSTVLFLGDNVYPSGFKPKQRSSVMRLESQLGLLRNFKGQVYFVPGNHDWDAQGSKGLKTLANEQQYVQSFLKNKTTVANKDGDTFLPKDGLPGPETVLLNAKLRLILIDTQWFLHQYKKNKIQSKKYTKQLFYNRLDSMLLLASNNGEQVIVAAHHPLYSNGQHSSGKQPLRFLINKTPFQIFGLLGLNRLLSQDMDNPRYKKMRKLLFQSLNKYTNIVFVSGHDHNLQCFKEGGNRYIVSGSGSKLTKLNKRKRFDSIFQDDSATGFIKLNYSSNGIEITIFRVEHKELILQGY